MDASYSETVIGREKESEDLQQIMYSAARLSLGGGGRGTVEKDVA